MILLLIFISLIFLYSACRVSSECSKEEEYRNVNEQNVKKS